MDPDDKQAVDASADEADRDMDEEALWNKAAKSEDGDGRDSDDDAPEDQDPSEEPDDTDPAPKTAPDNASKAGKAKDTTAALDYDEIKRRWENDKERMTAHQRKIERLQAQHRTYEARIKKLEAEAAAAGKRNQRLSQAAEEYPDVTGPAAEEINALRHRLETWNRDAMETVRAEQQAVKGELDDIQKEQAAILMRDHPEGYETLTKNATAFHQWIEDQPAAMRKIYAQNESSLVDGAAVSYLIASFKQHLSGAPSGSGSSQSRLTSRRQSQMAGARSAPSQRTERVAADPIPDTDDEEALWYALEEAERRKKRG